MTPTSRAQDAATITFGGVLAAIGSLAAAHDVGAGIDFSGWVVRSCATLAAVVLVLFGESFRNRSTVERRAGLIAAMLVALLLPYSVESSADSLRAYLAIIATVLSFMIWRRGRGTTLIVAGLAAGLACAFEATAILWPFGCALAATQRKSGRPGACVILLGAIVGLVVGRAYGLSFGSGYANGGGLAGVHRDLTILMPIVLLGTLGYSAARPSGTAGPRGDSLSWTVVALGGLFLAFLGAPLDLRICSLPLVLWIPTALAEVMALVTASNDSRRTLRTVGFLSCVVVVCLSIPGAARLLDGPLVAVFVLAG